MAYSDFTLPQIEKTFGVAIRSNLDLFAPQPPTIALHPTFKAYLDYSIPLALSINTEKARSEMMIAPILIELKRMAGDRLSLFSGTEFNVDGARGLNGFCDFIISLSSQQLYLQSPVVIIFEAKNENIKGGLAQCIAAMIAAQIFNQNNEMDIDPLFGAVTTGNQWKFLKLQQNRVLIDTQDYYIDRLDLILGILLSMTRLQPLVAA
jgi:hypothetical protein